MRRRQHPLAGLGPTLAEPTQDMCSGPYYLTYTDKA